MSFYVEISGRCDSCRETIDEDDKTYCDTCLGKQVNVDSVRAFLDRKRLIEGIAPTALAVLEELITELESAP